MLKGVLWGAIHILCPVKLVVEEFLKKDWAAKIKRTKFITVNHLPELLYIRDFVDAFGSVARESERTYFCRVSRALCIWTQFGIRGSLEQVHLPAPESSPWCSTIALVFIDWNEPPEGTVKILWNEGLSESSSVVYLENMKGLSSSSSKAHYK